MSESVRSLSGDQSVLLSGRGDSQLEIKPLGAGCEVGRSCIMMRYRGKTVMFDCGLHPAKKGKDALPLFDSIDPKTVDVVLITHCHTDHCAALPYFVTRTAFRGEIVMTSATRDLIDALLDDAPKASGDSAPVAAAADTTTAPSPATPEESGAETTEPAAAPATTTESADDRAKESDLDEPPLYTKEDIQATLSRVRTISFNQTVKLDGISITCYNAGHILGASMFLVEIDGRSVLYTGDYSREEDHHLKSATVPPGRKVDVLICESTFGIEVHKPRRTREERFTKLVRGIVKRGGHCLIPMFAVGRTQELLLLLDEFWDRNPDLASFPLYWVSNKADKYLQIFKNSREFMNNNVQLFEREHTRMTTKDPFDFKHVRVIKQSGYREEGPCVVIASPGMLQNGVSFYFYNMWHDDPANGIIFAGYSVKNSFSYSLLEPSRRVEIKASVDEESFSAHADYKQTKEFIDALSPRYTVLVHGEVHKMNTLCAELRRRYNTKMAVFMPKNNQAVQLYMPRQDGVVKIIGSLAQQCKDVLLSSDKPDDPMEDSEGMPQPRVKRERLSAPVDGFLVHQDSTYTLTSAKDLSRYTRLKTAEIRQVTELPFTPSLRLLSVALNDMFGYSGIASSAVVHLDEKETFVDVVGRLRLSRKDSKTLMMEWTGGVANDDLADTVASAAISLEVEPEALARIQRLEEESRKPKDNMEVMRKTSLAVLHKHFGAAEIKPDDPNTVHIETEALHATLTIPSFNVTCDDPNKESMIKGVADLLRTTLTPMKNSGSRSETVVKTEAPSEMN